VKDFRPAKKRAEVSVGESVRIIRELQGLSQNQLSELSGIPQATLSAIERGRVRLGVERAKVLARALRCHPDSGRVAVPERTRRRTAERIEKYAAEHHSGKYTRGAPATFNVRPPDRWLRCLQPGPQVTGSHYGSTDQGAVTSEAVRMPGAGQRSAGWSRRASAHEPKVASIG
jgi:transcriptional regulator with XRE-family HTH domain